MGHSRVLRVSCISLAETGAIGKPYGKERVRRTLSRVLRVSCISLAETGAIGKPYRQRTRETHPLTRTTRELHKFGPRRAQLASLIGKERVRRTHSRVLRVSCISLAETGAIGKPYGVVR